ncbi:MAG: formylglycine-generating enzyme family protein [Kiritimatiellae bacterium]|nr:formylglycine-generating enzyme family protein [Kiritimatiellia bacterium]
MKMILGSFAACLAFGAMADAPAISQVTVRQRWPWSRLVDIDYVLGCGEGESVDVAVTAYNGTDVLNVPLASFVGDLYGVTQGLRHIVWDPTVTAYTNRGVLQAFNVALTPSVPPLYMIVDLTKDAGADGQIEYVYEDALTNGLWGAWVRNPVTNNSEVIESVVWTGVASNDLYKTDKLVLRRVPADSFQMGDTQNGTPNVTLTKGMYAGVFEVTQKQWNHVMGTTGGTATQAKHTISYYEIREYPANTDDPAVDWPSNKTVNAGSFMGRLRAKTGISEFDLPTEAQWEYLCRAGTTTVFNDGNADVYYTGSVTNNNGNTNEYLNALGWYKYNEPTPPTAAQPVGGKRPNAWGLYDTHGNVWEWCLDWYGTSAELGTDPDGAVSGSSRVIRGGSWFITASYCRSANRDYYSPSSRNFNIGFRLVRTLP